MQYKEDMIKSAQIIQHLTVQIQQWHSRVQIEAKYNKPLSEIYWELSPAKKEEIYWELHTVQIHASCSCSLSLERTRRYLFGVLDGTP